ncbi:MAG TPA: hypothetical protein VF316_11800, partial [Polyangiaceae bacterium]
KGRLESADLLLLGALADLVRKEEVGDDVRVHANVQTARDGVPAHVERGLDLLRAVAIARITGAKGAAIRVDWGVCGLEIAQVALGFGANELIGPIASKRGLPIAEDETKKLKGQGMVAVQLLKTRELAGLLRRAGREPVFVSADGNHVAALEVRP